jgi:putative colanic acid biosynthesis acetyltransferase WcaF
MTAPTKTARQRLRRAPSPSLGDKVRRFIWIIVQTTLYRYSPVPLHGWRRFLLRLFGAWVSELSHPYPTARIWAPWNLDLGPGSCLGPGVICYSVARITLDAGAIVSQGAHLCAATHNHRDPEFPLVVGPIRIGAQAWVATEAFIGPGVHISERAVVGARAVVTKDVPPGLVVAGNPAHEIAPR